MWEAFAAGRSTLMCTAAVMPAAIRSWQVEGTRAVLGSKAPAQRRERAHEASVRELMLLVQVGRQISDRGPLPLPEAKQSSECAFRADRDCQRQATDGRRGKAAQHVRCPCKLRSLTILGD